MPIAEQNTMNTYTGNGVATTYAYTFKVFANTDLRVTVGGVLKTLTTDYTITGVGADGGGNVVFVTPPANLAVVTIYREMPYSRTTDYTENGDFKAQTIDDDLDKQTMLTQQMKRDIKRAIKLPIEETTNHGVTDTPASRANKVLAFDAAGVPVVKTVTDLSVLASTVGAGLQLVSGDLSIVNPVRQGVAAGTVDAITATFSPTVTSLANNLTVMFEALGANTAAVPSFNPNGLGAKNIIRIYGGNSIPLSAGDIPGVNYRVYLAYDTGLDQWIILNPAMPPNLTTAERDALTAVNGMFIFNNTVGRHQVRRGGLWKDVIDPDSTDTMAGKTLISPVLTSPKIANTDYIVDGNGTAILQFNATASAVNRLAVTNAATGSGPSLIAIGSDPNIDIVAVPLGAGVFKPGRLLGARNVTPTLGTVYQAATDMVIHARANGGGVNFRFAAYTDGSNPPTTILDENAGTGGAGWDYASVYMEVRKGDYWKVANTSGSATGVTITATPLG